VGTWVTRLEATSGGRPRVAVKDAIDVRGVVTTAGCRAVADSARPASADAECLRGFRAHGADLIGKTTLDELCLSASGRNDWLGMPTNPRAPDRIPGGSSSGSAVAVATGEADIGLGTDTGGSVRIPAACCGVVGLKTTRGRIPVDGVWPLAPSLDSVGPLAADVAGVVRAMALLTPWTWRGPVAPARTLGRLRLSGIDAAVEAAVDDAVDASGLEVRPVSLGGWADTSATFDTILLAEFHQRHADLLDVDGVSPFVKRALRTGAEISADELAAAYHEQQRWTVELTRVFRDVDVLVLPTLVGPAPTIEAAKGFPLTALTAPFNVAGVPALSVPLPAGGGPVPPSLQLVGPPDGEDLLCATALTAFGGGGPVTGPNPPRVDVGGG
jgi:amidase